MAASGAQGAGLGGDDELDHHPGAHEEGAPPIGLGNQQEGAPAAAGGAPDPLAGLGQTNVRALAAREIVPDAEVWDVAQWPKNRKDKPQLLDLKAEILWRDRTGKVRPAHWKAHDMCEWLHEHGLPGEHADGRQEAGADDDDDDDDDDDPILEGPSRRWTPRTHMIRLLHVIVATKTDFLQRDKKAKCRNAMEAGARDSYWHTAALKFCDKTFRPALLTPSDELHGIFVKARLTPAWTAYPAEAKKLKEEFRDLRKRVSLAMQKFKQSGMGDLGDLGEEERARWEADYNQKYHGSKFTDFAGGDDIVLYAYALLVQNQDGLLESACTSMPKGKGSSSTGPARKVAQTRGRGRSGSGQKKKKKNSVPQDLMAAINRPISIRKSEAEQATDHYRLMEQRSRAKVQQAQHAKELEAQLKECRTVLEGLPDGEEKDYFERKKARILREMQKLEDSANAPSPAVTAGSSGAGSGAKGKGKHKRMRDSSDDDEEEEDFDEFPYDSDAEDSGNGDEEDEGNGDEDEDDEDL